MNLRLYISPFFLHRYYLRKNIQKVLKRYKFKGSVVDIGCGSKPYEHLFTEAEKYEGIDFKDFSVNKDSRKTEPDYYFKKSYLKNLNLPFKSGSFNNIVAFQVLEHHKNPTKMFSEMMRILRKGGYILLSFPFIGGLHEEPHDYQRLTEYSLKELVSPYKAKIVTIKKQGSVCSTISMILNEYLNEFASKSSIHYKIAALIYPPFLLFSYLCLVGDRVFKSKKIFIGYLVLIKK